MQPNQLGLSQQIITKTSNKIHNSTLNKEYTKCCTYNKPTKNFLDQGTMHLGLNQIVYIIYRQWSMLYRNYDPSKLKSVGQKPFLLQPASQELLRQLVISQSLQPVAIKYSSMSFLLNPIFNIHIYQFISEFDSESLYILYSNRTYQIMKNSAWLKGPTDHMVCTPPHDRPIFSLAVSDNNFVTGSADHGLREYNIQTGKHVRQLFSKKFGHKQWVSTCAYSPTGNIISGAMDSMVCYWDSKAVRCDHLNGHGGSISKVMASQRVGISASYDATIILWDLAKKSQSKKLIGPHKQSVMTFDWNNSLLVSGDKSGVLGIWDLNRGQIVRAIKTHKGSVSKLIINGKQGLIYSLGLNDGTLAALDMRTNQGVYRQMLHKGAGNDIKLVDNKVITCSADHTINVLQVPAFKTSCHINIKDMAFALESAYGVIVAATSGGNIVACDINSGEILYGYGVMKKGQCRLLGLSKDKQRLVCAGQDQSPSLLCF